MVKIVIIAFLLIVVQGILTISQIKNYRDKLSSLKRMGIVGVGAFKGKIRPGNITILVSNRLGKIIKCERMEGMTIFSRFKEIKDVCGLSIEEVRVKCQSNSYKSSKDKAMLDAVDMLEKNLLKLNQSIGQ